jgi:hypothetical protein
MGLRPKADGLTPRQSASPPWVPTCAMSYRHLPEVRRILAESPPVRQGPCSGVLGKVTAEILSSGARHLPAANSKNLRLP